MWWRIYQHQPQPPSFSYSFSSSLLPIPPSSYFLLGGGFAYTQSQPDYQKDFVQSFLSSPTLPPLPSPIPPFSMFKQYGRAYPDVSAVGHNLMTVLGRQFIPVGVLLLLLLVDNSILLHFGCC